MTGRRIRKSGSISPGKAGEGLASALGASPLAPAGLLGGAASAGGLGTLGQGVPQLKTAAYNSRLQVGELVQQAYLVELSLDKGIWARTWVDASGEVLLVETSMGWTMRSDRVENWDRINEKRSAHRPPGRQDANKP